MMATRAAPVAIPEIARAVVGAKSYAAWDPLLDLFDTIRSQTPVLRIEAGGDGIAPFWVANRDKNCAAANDGC